VAKAKMELVLSLSLNPNIHSSNSTSNSNMPLKSSNNNNMDPHLMGVLAIQASPKNISSNRATIDDYSLIVAVLSFFKYKNKSSNVIN